MLELAHHCADKMLSAKRKSNGETVIAYFETRAKGPFTCLDCSEEVVLKSGKSRINHFAHASPVACKFPTGESATHLNCKLEIHLALQKMAGIADLALERPSGNVRPDISAKINGVPIAIEVQISSLPRETIQQRTIEYAREGLYVLWLLQWTPKLDSKLYTPSPWEKWLHAVYFGRVYYWIEGLTVVSYHFDPSFITVPKKSWVSPDGEEMSAGGYNRRSKRYRTPIRGKTFNLATDFLPKDRDWWEGDGIVIPFAKLFMDAYPHSESMASFTPRPGFRKRS
jgi:competence protein CoiA